jgi:hypothetical protein
MAGFQKYGDPNIEHSDGDCSVMRLSIDGDGTAQPIPVSMDLLQGCANTERSQPSSAREV